METYSISFRRVTCFITNYINCNVIPSEIRPVTVILYSPNNGVSFCKCQEEQLAGWLATYH